MSLTVQTIERLRDAIQRHLTEVVSDAPRPTVKSLLKLHFALQEITMEDSGQLIHMYSRELLGRVLLDKCRYIDNELHIAFVPVPTPEFITFTVELK